VQNFSRYAEATPSNIKSLVQDRDMADFKMERTRADKSGTQFIWLPMVRPASSLSFMPPDRPIPLLPHLYFTSQIPCNLYSLSMRNPLIALEATHAHPHVIKQPLIPFLCAVPAIHIPLFFLTLLPKMSQADTSCQGEAGRWVQLIRHKPHVGNNWSTATITAAEKAKALFPATVNEVHQQMNYSKVPTPHGGFAQIFPCKTLYCSGKKTRDAAADGGTKTIPVVADATRATPVDTNLTTCRKFIGNAYSYKYYNTNFWTSLDTRASIATGCPNKCIVCNDCAQTIQQSPCTSPADTDPKDVTVACACGASIHMIGLEGTTTQKGLPFDSIVLKVNSPTSIQRNVSRSQGSSAPTDVAFAIANFPDTDNAEMEVENFLEMRLLNVTCKARYNRDKKTMTPKLTSTPLRMPSRVATFSAGSALLTSTSSQTYACRASLGRLNFSM